MTEDTMTSGQPESALSSHDGADALAALRVPPKQEQQKLESADEPPPAEEAEVEQEQVETESQAAEEESTEPEEQASIEITLKDGTKITAEEAAKGYYRLDDYTRDKQKLHREFSQKEAQFQAQSAEYVKHLQSVFQEVVSMLPQEPDWAARVDEVGSDQALKEQIQWNARQKTLAQARAEILEHNKVAMAQAQIKAREALLAGEFDASWKDPKALSSAMEKVSDYLSSYGYGAEVLTSLADPNIAIIAEKARRFDELQKAKPAAIKAVKDKPKPLKPGARTGETVQERTNKQVLNRFHQTKSTEDGMAALASLRAGSSS